MNGYGLRRTILNCLVDYRSHQLEACTLVHRGCIGGWRCKTIKSRNRWVFESSVSMIKWRCDVIDRYAMKDQWARHPRGSKWMYLPQHWWEFLKSPNVSELYTLTMDNVTHLDIPNAAFDCWLLIPLTDKPPRSSSAILHTHWLISLITHDSFY